MTLLDRGEAAKRLTLVFAARAADQRNFPSGERGGEVYLYLNTKMHLFTYQVCKHAISQCMHDHCMHSYIHTTYVCMGRYMRPAAPAIFQ